MRLMPLDAVIVPENRQRREFDEAAIVELADSIARLGLMHPIVVHADNRLIAGERRLRAVRFLGKMQRPFHCGGVLVDLGHVPVLTLGDLTHLQIYEAELEENVLRKDLTWQELAHATKQLTELRRAQAVDRGEDLPTAADIAEEVTGRRDGSYQHTVSQQLMVSKHLDDADVKAAPTLKEAVKVLKRKEDLARSASLASAVGASYSRADLTVEQGNCFEFLKNYNGVPFDVLLTDPPYGMGADEFGDSGGKTQSTHSYDDSEASFIALMQAWVPKVSEVLAPQAHVYQFCDFDKFAWLKRLWTDSGFKVFRTPLLWFKPSAYRAPWPTMGPQRKYETILYAVRGDKPTLRLGGDVLQYNPDENLNHNAQKPVALFQDLLSRSARPGDNVLDCFCGSGPIFPAAFALKVKATGCEMDPAYAGIALERIAGLL